MSHRKEIIVKFVMKQSAGILKGIIARIGEEYSIRFCCLTVVYLFTIPIGSLQITGMKETKEVCSSDYITSTWWQYICLTLSDSLHIYFPINSLCSSWCEAVGINSLSPITISYYCLYISSN